LYSLNAYVKALEQVVNEITPTPFVVGHSMGGLVLQRYLKTHELPGAVLLCSVPPFGARTSFLHYILKHPLRFLVGNLTTRLDLMMKTPKLAAEYFLTEGATLTGEELSAKLQNESLLAAIEFGFVPRTNPRQVTSPVLVVAAGCDAIIPVPETQSTAKAYGAEYVLFEDQGHSLMVERRWQEVAAEIRAWFERVQTLRT
jgi:pimeloyl-ACP methyl ester carboxylesterase